jgi:hypothetical protein
VKTAIEADESDTVGRARLLFSARFTNTRECITLLNEKLTSMLYGYCFCEKKIKKKGKILGLDEH